MAAPPKSKGLAPKNYKGLVPQHLLGQKLPSRAASTPAYEERAAARGGPSAIAPPRAAQSWVQYGTSLRAKQSPASLGGPATPVPHRENRTNTENLAVRRAQREAARAEREAARAEREAAWAEEEYEYISPWGRNLRVDSTAMAAPPPQGLDESWWLDIRPGRGGRPVDVSNISNPDYGAHLDNVVRKEVLSRQRELSDSEYAALSPTQQAAVQFNTGMLDAAQADLGTRSRGNTQRFVDSLGLESLDQRDLDGFLQLDRLVSDKILNIMDDPARVQAPTSSLGFMGSEPQEQRDVSNARQVSYIASRVLADLLTESGTRTLAAPTGEQSQRLGYGNTGNDERVREVYGYMIDSTMNLSKQEILDDIAYLRNDLGWDITPEDVWSFAADQFDALELNQQSGRGQRGLNHPEFAWNGEVFVPVADLASIREKYGF